MARECGPGRWVGFDRTDRDYVTWSSSGLSGAATASAELEEDGVLHPLTINVDTGDLTGYFAGPDFPSPAPAVVFTTTSHVEVHVIDSGVHRTLDGGFLRLLP